MLWRFLNKQRQEVWNKRAARRGSFSLQLVLWALWTLLVVGVACISWLADRTAERPINMPGLVIHCAVAGLIGLVVMTVVEMHLEPERFIDQ